MYYVYILYSKSAEQYYCGQTSDLHKRLFRHNSGETPSIKHGIPWIMIGYIPVESRSESVLLEKKIKKRGIERWINQYSNMLQPG